MGTSSITGIALLLLYFVPTIVAMVRGKSNVIAIGALNGLLGWTVLGWIGAFVWALMKDTARPQLP